MAGSSRPIRSRARSQRFRSACERVKEQIRRLQDRTSENARRGRGADLRAADPDAGGRRARRRHRDLHPREPPHGGARLRVARPGVGGAVVPHRPPDGHRQAERPRGHPGARAARLLGLPDPELDSIVGGCPGDPRRARPDAQHRRPARRQPRDRDRHRRRHAHLAQLDPRPIAEDPLRGEPRTPSRRRFRTATS